MVCRLKKTLYGLKKEPRTQYARLDKYLENLGFAKGTTDSNLYLKKNENGLLIIVIFVDDIFFGGNDEGSDNFFDEMKNEFDMSMISEMKYFFSLQIVQNSDGIFLSQNKYLKDLLKIFGLESCKLIGTPMITSHKLSSKDETPTLDQKNYRSMIGGLQYLTHTRPDIENVVGTVARFQVDPREAHYVVLKRIFKCLKGTPDKKILEMHIMLRKN